MTTPFSEKLRMVLKMLSMTSAQLASELEVDKSVVSRWLKGAVQPSTHNLSRLSALVAGRIGGFRTIDWERDPEDIGKMFGAAPEAINAAVRQTRPPGGLPIAIWEQIVVTTAIRGKAYEGFFRSTRSHSTMPGRFIHDHGMIRREENGLLSLKMGGGGTVVEGWMIPLSGQIYCIAADVTSGVMMFGIFNGIGGARIDVFDGLALLPGFDVGRSPTAMIMLNERIGELSGDREADDQRITELIAKNPLAPDGSVPKHVQDHLLRDFGPSQVAAGGDLLLTMLLSRSMTRGLKFDEPDSSDPAS